MKQNKKINPHFYTFSFWSGITALMIGGFLSGMKGSTTLGITMLCVVGAASIIYAMIYFLISLYRCWSILQGSTARTTPGKAVGFLFIPIFNFYWIFVAIRGLAKDANTFLSQKNITENKISVGFSLATCILLVTSWVTNWATTWPTLLLFLYIPYAGALAFYVGFLCSILFFIVMNILVYQWAKFFKYSVINLGVKYK